MRNSSIDDAHHFFNGAHLFGENRQACLWKHVKLASSGNTFDDCNFVGGEKALYVNSYGGATNQVSNSSFSGNEVAAYITDGALTLAGTDVQQSNGANGIIVRGLGDLATASTGSGISFAPTTIEDHNTGIYFVRLQNAEQRFSKKVTLIK